MQTGQYWVKLDGNLYEIGWSTTIMNSLLSQCRRPFLFSRLIFPDHSVWVFWTVHFYVWPSTNCDPLHDLFGRPKLNSQQHSHVILLVLFPKLSKLPKNWRYIYAINQYVVFLVREKVLFGMFYIYVLFPINTSAHQTYKFSKYHKRSQ